MPVRVRIYKRLANGGVTVEQSREDRVKAIVQDVCNKMATATTGISKHGSAFYRDGKSGQLLKCYKFLFSLMGTMLLYIPIKYTVYIISEIHKKANCFMPLPPNALGATGNCIINILNQHPTDFPVAGHTNGGTGSIFSSSIEQRPGFNYIQFDIVKQNATELNDMERERVRLLLQRYINSMLQSNLIDGIPQQRSNGGFPFLYIDAVEDKGTTIQLDILWVGHSNVENYIKNKNTPPPPPTSPGASDGDF